MNSSYSWKSGELWKASLEMKNLEIQWRPATLSEAKTVVSRYHKYSSENGLFKSVLELSASSLLVQRELSYRPTNGGSEAHSSLAS